VETNLDQQLDKILSKMAFKCAGGITDDGAKEYIPAKQAIKALIATEVLRARKEELSNLKAEKGRFSTSSYGLWVDGAIDNRIVELEAQLENK
jgi:hypothetical protein